MKVEFILTKLKGWYRPKITNPITGVSLTFSNVLPIKEKESGDPPIYAVKDWCKEQFDMDIIN